MRSFGFTPTWKSSTVLDRIVVLFSRTAYLLFYCPTMVVTLLLGWAKVNYLLLDLFSLPGSLVLLLTKPFGGNVAKWGRKVNAIAHMFFVCRMCPAARQATRIPDRNEDNKGLCAWVARWNLGDFDIPPNFGFKNWVAQFADRTKLDNFQSIAVKEDEVTIRKTHFGWKIATFTGSLILWAVIVTASIVGPFLYWYHLKTPGIGSAGDWQSLGEVPGKTERYPPQGLTLVGDKLVFSNHWQDAKSGLYLFDIATMSILAEAEMPPEAVHTSGLAWDGEFLWAVDYIVNRIYKLNLDETFATREAVVVDSYPTGLSGSSAATVVAHNGKKYLAVSDFLGTATSYFVAMGDIPRLKNEHIEDVAYITLCNQGFSQGCTWDGRYYYEALNCRGTDRILVFDIIDALSSGDSDDVEYLGCFFGSGPSIEDLATDGERLWTSDEVTYDFHLLPNLPTQVKKLFPEN